MPSIEILVPDGSATADPAPFPFAVAISSPPYSHRYPSLWQARFHEIGGTLYHLGYPELKDSSYAEGRLWFAYDLILDESDGPSVYLEFRPEFRSHVMRFLGLLLSLSIKGMIHFTSDWQACEEMAYEYPDVMTLGQFIALHDKGRLKCNSWTTISRGDVKTKRL
jgi:hypothetical protein